MDAGARELSALRVELSRIEQEASKMQHDLDARAKEREELLDARLSEVH